ncbi:Recombinase [Rubripirellula obstinata]|uniref:Recombinase n=1 Tax=Rubripirellula obstinata TaxID=406547 RepID=A0A5B1CD89_9BACT|nr:recombinase family protein [Rubripirellula obstinata]KAA1258201.1 Recombinase [Rubripirellula obstinata]
MNHWWEIEIPDADAPPLVRAVAYYRHSAQDRQENSIPIQQDQVRAWAREHGVEIIREFCDAGRSGLNSEGRPAFTEMMEEWIAKRNDFEYVLCLDVSRWGRFQDIDLSAQFSAICKKNKKQVIYTTIGKPKENDPLYPVYVQFERFRAAQYSRELSDKVWRGCVKIAEQGYLAGGKPPYGLSRLLLDEKREPLHVLEAGQHKGIQNQRVTLTEGPPEQVAVVRRIFEEFVEKGYSEFKIAEGLNDDGIPSPSNGRWGAGGVVARLRNEKYAGTMVYNRTSGKLKTPSLPNPVEKWVRTTDAFSGIIEFDLFLRAQEIFEKRKQRYDPDYMLRVLDELYRSRGMVRPGLLRLDDELPSSGAYSRQFGSLDQAFQNLFDGERGKARENVHEQIRGHIPEVTAYSDFLVLDQKLTVSIQPAVPIPHGYESYWPIRRDPRPVIDMTLGVLLSEPADFNILGFIALPRFGSDSKPIRFTSSSVRTELFGRTDLQFLQQLL